MFRTRGVPHSDRQTPACTVPSSVSRSWRDAPAGCGRSAGAPTIRTDGIGDEEAENDGRGRPGTHEQGVPTRPQVEQCLRVLEAEHGCEQAPDDDKDTDDAQRYRRARPWREPEEHRAEND